MAIIDMETAKQIRQAYDGKQYDMSKLATLYRVSVRTIRKIINNEMISCYDKDYVRKPRIQIKNYADLIYKLKHEGKTLTEIKNALRDIGYVTTVSNVLQFIRGKIPYYGRK